MTIASSDRWRQIQQEGWKGLIKPNRFTYVSPNVPTAAVSKPQEAAVAPGLPSPTEMAGGLLGRAGQAAGQVADGAQKGIDMGIDARYRLAPLLSGQAWDASKIRTNENRENLTNFTDSSLRLSDQTFNQSMTVADRYAQLTGNTNSGVIGAIAGEQANDAAKLQLMRDVLMKPKSFGEAITELTGAIAPIAALFI